MVIPGDSKLRSIGVNFLSDGKSHVRVWAPLAKQVSVKFREHHHPLQKKMLGYWETENAAIKAGDLYTYCLNGEKDLPDPASLSQPQGVHGPSQAIDLSVFSWTDQCWINPSLDAYIFYELHVGTFTAGGDFASIRQKIPYLKELGITAIEIMPVVHFPGARNWGYDGVFPFAVHTCYGGATELQTLVNACHEAGLAVVLDVVYNHLGPEGNYLPSFGPYFTDKYKTPWGQAINFDDAWCDGVRHYFIENALMWFRDFHIDALRLDAVHAIKDFSPVHILREIKEAVDQLIQREGRSHYLIAELDLNDPRFIDPIEKEGLGMDAQWIDEFHHALRVTTGQERVGYYEDFEGIHHLAKAYRDAYVYDGQYSQHRAKFFGRKAEGHGGNKFVVFSQNHDQVGNRMLGERTSQLVSFDMLKVLAAATLLSPYLPLLFMGEEYGESNPFFYFVHHGNAELIENVRTGRKAEFNAFHTNGEFPDPQDETSFNRSKLAWNFTDTQHAKLFAFYKSLIELRKKHSVLRQLSRESMEAWVENEYVLILHRYQENNHIWCILNFSTEKQSIHIPGSPPLKKIMDSSYDELAEFSSLHTEIFQGPVTMSPVSVLIYTS